MNRRIPPIISLIFIEIFLLFSGISFAQNQGYLHVGRQEIAFFQINRIRERLNGVVQIISLVDGYSGKSLGTKRYPFSGTISGNDVSINFGGFLSQSIVTGTYTTSRLNLSMPQQDGSIAIITYKRSNVSQFNKAVSNLRIAAARINAQIAYQRYATKINQDIFDAFETVKNQIERLKNVKKFDISPFEKDLKEMQKEENKFLISLRGNELVDAKYEFSNLQYTKNSILYDRNSLEYDFKNAKNVINNSKESLQNLNLIWNEYWVALAKDNTGLIRRDIDKNLLSEYSEAVNLAVREVGNLIASADAKAIDIESQTSKIVSEAKKSLEEAEKRKPN